MNYNMRHIAPFNWFTNFNFTYIIDYVMLSLFALMVIMKILCIYNMICIKLNESNNEL